MGAVGHPWVRWDGTPPQGVGVHRAGAVPVPSLTSWIFPYRSRLRHLARRFWNQTWGMEEGAEVRGPFPCPAGVRTPPQHEEGPEPVPPHPGEPQPSGGSCSELSLGALAFTNSRNVLSLTKTDPSCSVHDPFPSLVLLGLVYPRFCCGMRLFGC